MIILPTDVDRESWSDLKHWVLFLGITFLLATAIIGTYVAASSTDAAAGDPEDPGDFWGEEEAEGEVGAGLGEDARRARDEDETAAGVGDVDVVVAGGHVADGDEIRSGGEEGSVDAVGEEGEEAVGGGCFAAEVVGRRRQLVGPDGDFACLSQEAECVAGEVAGDENARAIWHRG